MDSTITALARAAGRVRPRVAATALAVLAGLFLVAGAVADAEAGRLTWLDVDGELGVPAVVSAAVLVLAGVAVALALLAERAPLRVLALPAFLVFMAADEFAYLHERAETRTGVDWQVLYLPVAAVGGLALLAVVRRWRSHPGATPLLVGGAGAWVVAQLLEALEWGPGDVKVDGYRAMAAVEEALEVVGSGLWLLAGLVVLRAVLVPAVPDRSAAAVR